MATFVLFVDTPTWEVHYDPDLQSYHFEGQCTVRVFMFVGRPFSHPVHTHRFSPESPYGDDTIFERARTHNERVLRMHTAASGAFVHPEYVPRSRFSETDPSEDPPTHVYSESSAPAPPPMRMGSEETVTQPRLARRQAMRPRRGAHVPTTRVPTPEELRPWMGYMPPFQGQE